jgi:hypothetical protein
LLGVFGSVSATILFNNLHSQPNLHSPARRNR